MELRHLRYFVAAAEEEHFGRAAERLHVTRPAVSKLIADLEHEIDATLFERLAHGVRLTEAGRELLPRLQAIVGDLGEAFHATRRVAEGRRGSISIGYGSLTLLHPLFRAAVKEFRQRYPDVALSLLEAPSPEQRKALVAGRITAGFMHVGDRTPAASERRSLRPHDDAILDWCPIQTHGLGVAVPADHPLARRRAVSMQELAREAFIVMPRSSSSLTSGLSQALCQQAGFEPRIVQDVGTVTSQLNLVSVGMGIALVPYSGNVDYPEAVTVVPLEHVEHAIHFVFGWLKGGMTPALSRMVEIVETLAATHCPPAETPAGPA
ncbi:LysR substrate-binding domain-containing protein [Xylophilus sp. GW821-FHT01B05]